MSRHLHTFSMSCIILAGLAACLLTVPDTAPAGVISIRGDTYSLDGGPAVTGAWEIAEKVMLARDAAIVIMEPKTKPEVVQNMLSLLENLKVPTLLTKRADFKELVKRGILKPGRTP